MSHLAFIALADDLTGAAELAAIGRRMGLRSVVCTEGQLADRRAELVVLDTDSRLCDPAEAARRVRTTLADVRRRDPGASIFKKVDSVLRGPVAVELAAAAAALGKSRVLAVPANPSLGRTIRDGVYRIDGVPLAETAFALDPHHPATSSRVLDMLGPDAGMPAISARPGCDVLPVGVVLGDATCIEDMDTWAHRLGDCTLAAGGADFFAAWLRNRGCGPLPSSAFPHLGTPVLLIAGSAAPASRANLANASAAGTALVPLPETLVTLHPAGQRGLSAWIEDVAQTLRQHRAAIVSAANIRSSVPWAPDAIRRAFATVAADLHRQGALKHLIIEGGATAAAAVHALGWSELTVVHEWAPGVASLRPPHPKDVYLTIKPGSYAWPDELWRQFVIAQPPAATL